MKAVILAGGFGTRISEESYLKPKPMIEIGEQPIMWHIMKYLSSYGINEFIICAGYKQHIIKQFFADYYLHRCDITFDFKNDNSVQIHSNETEPWKVTVVDTGLTTMTGGRIKQVKRYIGDETFLLTYGDGLCDVDINKLIKHHQANGKIATLTAIQPGERFGVLEFNSQDGVINFSEKRKADGGWINGGYMLLNSEIFDRIPGDETMFEKEPLESCVKDGQLSAYKHMGFWQCMDTMRDKEMLDSMWKNNQAPWKRW